VCACVHVRVCTCVARVCGCGHRFCHRGSLTDCVRGLQVRKDLLSNDIDCVAILRLLSDDAYAEIGISIGNKLRIQNAVKQFDAQFGEGGWLAEPDSP
jgi:hypothetical protein